MGIYKTSKEKKSVIMIAFAVLFCMISFLIFPVPFAETKAQNDDIDAFNLAFSQMMEKYSNLQEDQIVIDEKDFKIENDEILISASAVEEASLVVGEQNDFYLADYLVDSNDVDIQLNSQGDVVITKNDETNRLIVYSSQPLDDKNAVAVAEHLDYHVFQYADAYSAEVAYDYYSGLDCVQEVFYDYVITSQDVENYAQSSYESWGAEYVGFGDYTSILSATLGGREMPEVVVAVLDSGIYEDHPWFDGRLLMDYAYNYSGGNVNDVSDLNGHGTHVSGTIAESTLSNVKILPIKILDANGEGYSSYMTTGIHYVISLQDELNIKAINISAGFYLTSGTDPGLVYAVNSAYNNGIAVVVAAGNGDEKTGQGLPVENDFPANVESAITVAALSLSSSGIVSRATYSNYGKYIDFAAPGTNVISANNSLYPLTRTMSGTSMAAPHVTACVALLYSNPDYENYSVDQIYEILKDNAIDLGDVGWDSYYGYGMVNLSNIGVETVGNVEFSNADKLPESQFQLSLSYDYDENYDVKIYYTIDPYAESVGVEDNLYTKPLTISQTTKVMAVAYVYNDSALIQKSQVSTMTYYFDNLDLISNYEFDIMTRTITRYKGTELETLEVPSTISGLIVLGIGENAFLSNTSVKSITLPYSISTIGNYAFYGTKIREISCQSNQITLGSEAFRACSELTTFNVSQVVSVGLRAFADCSKLTSLNLIDAKIIYANAFANSGIKQVLIGKEITDIGRQTNLTLEKIYGYAGTETETFANEYGIEFVDLTLRITKDLTNVILIKGDTSGVDFSYVGYDVSNMIYFSGQTKDLAINQTSNGYEHTVNVSALSTLGTGEYTLYFSLTDYYGQDVTTNTIRIQVVSSTTPTVPLTYNQGNYYLYVNGQKASSSMDLFVGYRYEFRVEAMDGYFLSSFVLNDYSYAINETVSIAVNEPIVISVVDNEINEFSVTFNTRQQGNVLIEDKFVSFISVSRDESVKFSVESNDGYIVQKVLVNGETITCDENGYYYLDNIMTDVVVDITFQEAYYNIVITFGKGGSVTSAGGSIENVEHGGSRKFLISPSNGYAVDFVTVNGQEVSVVNNSFTLSNINENCNVVVSFKKVDSAFGENPTVMNYFLILVGIFVIFIVAKIALHFIRKEKHK